MELATGLGVQVDDLWGLPETLLEKALQEARFSVKQQVGIFARKSKGGQQPKAPVFGTEHSQSTEPALNALARHFEAQERRSRENWRATAETLASERASIAAQPVEQLREEYIELAKAHALSAEDALTIGYLLFTEDIDRRVWAATLMRKTGAERLRSHNFAVAARREDAFLAIHGTHLLNFSLPLYPHQPSFAALNTRILSTTQVTGAGNGFLQVSGAGYIPVHQFQDGSLGAETSNLEAINQGLKKQIQGLEKKVARIQESANSQGAARGRQGYNRGRGGRGQYRGGHETLRGGDTMEGIDAVPNNVTSGTSENKKDQPFRRVQ